MTRLIENASKMSKKKVATLDLGGTLVRRTEDMSSHQKIHTDLGLTVEEDKRLYDLNSDSSGKIYDHGVHAKEVTEKLQEKNRGEEDRRVYANSIQELLQGREIIEGAGNFVDFLKSAGYYTMILSSSPKGLTQPLADKLGVEGVYRFKDYEFESNGEFSQVYVNPEAYSGKGQVVSSLRENCDEVAHFGNGGNDIEAVENADIGLKQWNWTANPEKAYEEAREQVKS